MNTTYEWLYDHYAEPLLKEVNERERKEVDLLIEELALERGGQVELADHLSNIRLRWGAEVFALGLQLGVRLTAPIVKEP